MSGQSSERAWQNGAARAVCRAAETRYNWGKSRRRVGRATAGDFEGVARMGLNWCGVRGLGVAGLVLVGVLFGPLATLGGVSSVAYAQSVSDIVVEGNRRVEADTIRAYFRPGPGER